MKRDLIDLAVFGGQKAFAEPLHCGQLNLPEWDKVEKMFSGVFDRHYFSNHGVLAQSFEDKLCNYLNVRNAVTLTNGTIALMHTTKALGLTGKKIVVSAFTHPASVQALLWAGSQPIYCDVDHRTHLITPELVEPIINKNEVSAILAVHLWGNICDIEGFEALSEKYSIPVYYDAAHAFGCSVNGNMASGAGAAEIFSFNADNALNASEGGVVCTNDDELAEILRNLRSSYGRRKNVPIPVNGNGRFSELQAGLALLSLEDFEKNCANNMTRMNKYYNKLSSVEGVVVKGTAKNQEKHNYQNVILMINKEHYGLDRDTLFQVLVAENIVLEKYFTQNIHKSPDYKMDLTNDCILPVTEKISEMIMMVPSGQVVTEDSIDRICKIIIFAHENSEAINARLNKVSNVVY
jgi:dTDP-4-amino-4,6-dideoxygalactose transaminase